MVLGGSIESFIYRKIPWDELERIQFDLIQKATGSDHRFLLFSEPLPTFTHGRSAQKEDLLWDSHELASRGMTLAPVSRGGKWTYHGPGQILVYPIGSLKSWGFSSKNAKGFVETFRNCIATALFDWGVQADSKDEPYGLFVGNKKITSFGMSFENGISSHGAALYLTPQKEFSGIIPCGHQTTQFTCLKEQGRHIEWPDAANQVLQFFKKGFKLS